ncbi:hypothetical protein LBMAG52_09940 [Planctomycetia bacterium]|nr:hypothetical protein LBMAG52_09940 [Planctomycetia bacterium]
MATTPLKTASRALSIATVLVAGLTAWVFGTQGSTPIDQVVTEPVTGRTIEFAAVASKSPVEKSQDVAVNELDELDLATEDVIQQPRSRAASRPAMVFWPADVLQNSDSARVESQLIALQKKIDQLAQTQSEQKSNDVQKAIETLQQIQESKQTEKLENLEKLLQQLKESQPVGADPTKLLEPKPDTPKPNAPPEALAEDKSTDDNKPGIMHFEPAEGHQDRFDYIDFDDVDISQAISKLGQLSGMNILVGRGVAGRVPAANLQNVTAEEALNAITKSLGYVYEREGNFVYVWTATDSQARKQAARKTVSKDDRPRYVSVKDLQALIAPMLSKPGGLIAVTVPAEIGLGSCTNEVTSNVMIRDGSTIVIGGLIQEQANQKPDRIPGLGSLPFVGKLFKNKSNETTRTELIVLITPGVIHDPDAECEGDLPRSENEHRHQNFRDNLSPIDRHNLARVEYERAARYFEEGDAERAKRHIDESLRHNQLDNDALRLRDQIAAALNDKNWFKKLRRKPPTELHRVPSAPALQSNGAVFEFEQEVLDSGSKPLAPVGR